MPSVTIAINDSTLIAAQQVTDSLTQNSEVFEGIALPSNPHAESWVFGVLLSLFLMLVVAFSRSPAWIAESINRITRNRHNSGIFSSSTIHEFQTRLLLAVFTTGTIALYIYFEMFISAPFTLSTWIILSLITGAYLILKNLIAWLTGFVFLLTEEVKKAKIYFYSLYSFLGIMAFPILVLKLYINTPGLGDVFSFILMLIALILMLLFIILLFQIFYRKVLDFFYILLYLCTLEFLPLTGLFLAFKLFLEKQQI